MSETTPKTRKPRTPGIPRLEITQEEHEALAKRYGKYKPAVGDVFADVVYCLANGGEVLCLDGLSALGEHEREELLNNASDMVNEKARELAAQARIQALADIDAEDLKAALAAKSGD